MQCELSGESLPHTGAVVTPSGHICRKDLLLTKLAENGGVDPFHPDRPLHEDDLITLAAPQSSPVPPRPLQASSFPSLVAAVQQEYDAVVLELFDTRQALADARQELSQALYQNDAAARVIARSVAERDAARQKLRDWDATGAAAGTTTTATADNGNNKKRKLAAVPQEIPAAELQVLIDVWEGLHKGRKGLLKSLSAPSPEALGEFMLQGPTGTTWTSAVGQPTAASGTQLAQVTPEKIQLLQKSKVVASFPVGQAEVTTLDLSDEWIVWGMASGDVEFAKPTAGAKTKTQTVHVEAPVVNVSLHFGHKHAFVATKTGKVYLVNVDNATIVSVFSGPATYTTGCLHPDGLIYVAGTQQGALHIWDIKTQSLAATLDEPGSAPVQSVQVSPNGYHIAAAYADGAVRVWDLRKSKVLATLSTNGNVTTVVAFDQAGKFVLYGAGGTITAIPVKEWGKKLELSAAGNDISFVTWSPTSGIVGADDKGITCYGAP